MVLRGQAQKTKKMSSEQEADRISRHVQPLRNQLDILRQKLVHLQNWTVAHPELPHPAAVGGEMNWEKMVFEDFGNLEREFRKLDEKVSDARSSQLRQFVVVPKINSNQLTAIEGGVAEVIPIRLSCKLHPEMDEQDRQLFESIKRQYSDLENKDDVNKKHRSIDTSKDEEEEVTPGKETTKNIDNSPITTTVTQHNELVDMLLNEIETQIGRGLPFIRDVKERE